MTESKNNAIIGLVGAVVFAVCAIIVPFLKLTGLGFITQTEAGVTADMFWDKMVSSTGGISVGVEYGDVVDLWAAFGSPSNIEIIWTIIPLWGFAFIGLGLLGAVLVAIPALQKFGDMEASGFGTIGLILGLVASVVEILLFAIVGLLEENLDGGIENFGWIVIILSVVGWVGLFIGNMYGSKD